MNLNREIFEDQFEDINLNIANMFWTGGPLGYLEKMSLLSFVRFGFVVRLFTYDNLKVPYGVQICDARDIIAREYLFKYEQGYQNPSLAAFSDNFRYKLQEKKNGLVV